METENNRNKLIAGVAVAALVLGGGGIMLGRTMFAPETTAAAAAPAEEAEEEGHVEGQILMEESRAKAAGIVTEALQSGGLGAEILAQGVVASTPEGEAVLTARADGAVVRINRQLGDFVRAGESLMDGSSNPHDILRVLGEKELAKYLVDEVQEVYRLQGVKINDKHIEVIVRQMLRRVKIKAVGDTRILADDSVER